VGEPEQVVLFVYKDDRCGQLVKDVYEVLRSLGRPVRLKVVTAKVTDPRELPAFLSHLRDIYGDEYAEIYVRHQVRTLPTLVVGGVKVFEGRFPTRDELAELLGAPARAPAQAKRAAGPCLTCVFYDEQSSRCLLLREPVRDPASPPCGRRR